MSHESNATSVAQVHCRPMQKESGFFFSLREASQKPHGFQFLEPWSHFSREGNLCSVSYCTSQTGSPGIETVHQENLPADPLLSKPV